MLLKTISEEEIVELKKDIERYWGVFQGKLYPAIERTMVEAMFQRNNTVFSGCLFITRDITYGYCSLSPLQEKFMLYLHEDPSGELTEFLLSNESMKISIKNGIMNENELCLKKSNPKTYLDALIKDGAPENFIHLVYSFGIGAQTPRGQQWIREHYAPSSNDV